MKHFRPGLLLAALIALLALALPSLGSPATTAAQGEDGAFSVHVDAATEMGGVDVVIDLSGEIGSPPGPPPKEEGGPGSCQGGEVSDGTLTISDGAHTYTGTFAEGFANAGSCIPGLSDALFFQANGTMDDDAFTEFNVQGMGTLGAGGALTEVIGLIGSFVEGGPPEDLAETLQGAVWAFGGKFTGAGNADGFESSGGGGGTFKLEAQGTLGGQSAVLTINGSIQSFGPPGASAGGPPPRLEAENGTLKVGNTTYDLDVKKFRVNLDGSRGRILIGANIQGGGKLTLNGDVKASGDIFENGGSADVNLRSGAVKIGSEVLKKPSLKGQLTVTP